jgi:phage regulator Rha-like protein
MKSSLIPDETIIRKIYLIRGQKVMFDSDLAELYGVETKVLKQAVKRNLDRFPEKYMFELSLGEAEISRSQFVTLKQGQNIKHRPFVFTEHGVLMLSNVLKSKQAIQVSMRIIDMFVYLREVISTNDNLRNEIENIKKKIENHGKNIELVFQYLDELIEKKEKPRT